MPCSQAPAWEHTESQAPPADVRPAGAGKTSRYEAGASLRDANNEVGSCLVKKRKRGKLAGLAAFFRLLEDLADA